MSCGVIWTDECILPAFSKSFVDTLRRKSCERLWSQQWQLMPATQREIERSDLRTRVWALEDARLALHTALRGSRLSAPDREMFDQALAGPLQQVKAARQELNQLQADEGGEARESEGGRRAFVKACPREACNGVLNNAYSCGLCKTRVCGQCFAVKRTESDDGHARVHVCDANDVLSAEAIKRDTKNCPKCGVSIHKIDGCSQMWCVQCHTAFEWRTLKVLGSRAQIHNPHYFEFLRRSGGGAAPGGAGGCDDARGMDARAWDFVKALRNLGAVPSRAFLHLLDNAVRTTIHMREIHGRFVPEPDFADLRVSYLRGVIDRAGFQRKAFVVLNRNRKRKMVYDLVQMLHQILVDVLQGTPCMDEVVVKLENARMYYNENAARIRKVLKSKDRFFAGIAEGWLIA
jgi:hypothetical protein